MKVSNTGTAIAHDPEALHDAEGLLGRYPEIDESERDRLAEFLRSGAPIDIGLLSSNRQVWRAADRFRRDHPKYFRMGARGYAGWAAAVTGLGLGLVLIKDMGIP